MKISKGKLAGLIVFVVIASVTAGYFGNQYYSNKLSDEETTTTTFSLTFTDLAMDFTIDENDLVGKLWKTTDLTSGYQYTLLKSYLSGGIDVSPTHWADKLDAGEMLVLEVINGTCDESAYTVIEDDGIGDRAYGSWLQQIYPDRANSISLAQVPSDAAHAVHYSGNFSAASLPYPCAQNYTILVASNATEDQASYQRCTGYKEDLVAGILCVFNTTIDDDDVLANGLTIKQINTTAILLEINARASITSTPQAFDLCFAPSTPTNNITSTTLQYAGAAI